MSLFRKQLCDTSLGNRSIGFDLIILLLEISSPERTINPFSSAERVLGAVLAVCLSADRDGPFASLPCAMLELSYRLFNLS